MHLKQSLLLDFTFLLTFECGKTSTTAKQKNYTFVLSHSVRDEGCSSCLMLRLGHRLQNHVRVVWRRQINCVWELCPAIYTIQSWLIGPSMWPGSHSSSHYTANLHSWPPPNVAGMIRSQRVFNGFWMYSHLCLGETRQWVTLLLQEKSSAISQLFTQLKYFQPFLLPSSTWQMNPNPAMWSASTQNPKAYILTFPFSLLQPWMKARISGLLF